MITTWIGRNVYITSLCLRMWHATYNIFGFLKRFNPNLENAILQRNLAFQMGVLKRLAKINFRKNLRFGPLLFWVEKMPKNGCTYFLYLYKFLDYNEVLFSPYRNKEEEENNYTFTGCLIFNVGPKRWFLLFFSFSSFYNLSSTLILQRVAFWRFWFGPFQKFKYTACSMSHSVTNCSHKNVAPYSGRDHFLPMILNAVLTKGTCKWFIFNYLLTKQLARGLHWFTF